VFWRQQASESIKAASSKSGTFFPAFLQDYTGRIQHSLDQATKDNDFIYHDRVPDIKNVEAVAKYALAKQLPYQVRHTVKLSMFS
jgi:programmed cell death 6-interacting protein